jgi:hypothetical protein
MDVEVSVLVSYLATRWVLIEDTDVFGELTTSAFNSEDVGNRFLLDVHTARLHSPEDNYRGILRRENVKLRKTSVSQTTVLGYCLRIQLQFN